MKFLPVLNKSLDLLLTRSQQIRLGRYILSRARGEGNDDPRTNGEYRLLRTVKSRLRHRSAVFFDVGAHLGGWTVAAASGMPASLTVYAFEPAPSTFAKLKKGLAKAQLAACVIPANIALGESNGVAPFWCAGELAGTSSCHLRHAEAHGVVQRRVEGVTIRRGDDFCTDSGIDHISFLKIDIEGHEMAVLQGLNRMISEGRVDYIQFEYGETWLGPRKFLWDAFEFLTSRHYLVGKLFPDGIEFLGRYDEDYDNFGYANYVAVRSEFSEGLSRAL